MTSLSPENVSPRAGRRRRKSPKNTALVKRVDFVEEARTKAKTHTLAIDRLREEKAEILKSPTKPFPSPDRREKIIKKIEISDERLENSFGFDKEEDRELITSILTVRTRRRGEKEIALLQKAFKKIKFFEQVEKEVDSISFNRIFQKLTLESFEPGQTIFNYDDIGRKFYILIKGSVYILLKKEKTNNFVRRSSVRASVEDIGKMRQNMRAFFYENALEENKQSYVEKCYPGFWIVRTMGEGDSFGEIALNINSDGLRTATVLCKEETTVGVLSYNDYQAILGNLYERKYREKIDFLSNIDFLGHWTDNQLSSLIYNMEEVKFNRKNIIFREGDVATHMYFIFKGEVEIQKNSERERDNNNDRNGSLQRTGSQKVIQNGKIVGKSKAIRVQEPIKLGILTEKGYFGEVEVMNSKPREFTAIAHSTEVRLFSVIKEKFCAIVQDQKSLKLARENGHKKSTLREERIFKFSHRNASLELSNSIEEITPVTKTHRQASPEMFLKGSMSGSNTPGHANNLFESNISMLPFNDQSMLGSLHFLDKEMGLGKVRGPNALSLQRSVSKLSSGSLTESELNHSKLIFQRQFAALKNPRKGTATHIDRKKWLKQAIEAPEEQPSEIEETKETKETVTEKQAQNEIEENYASFNFVKKGIPVTQVGKQGSLTCLSPKTTERRHNYNASLDCLDKIDSVIIGNKRKESISRHSRVASIDNIKSIQFDNSTPRTAKSISKTVKDFKKEELYNIKKIETGIKGILKKHQDKVWPIHEGGLPEKEYFSYRSGKALIDRVSPRLPNSLASFRQSGDFIRNGLRNY